MARLRLAVLLLAVLAAVASASLPSFCKCTCGQNSTIIALGPQHDTNDPPPPPPPPPPKPSSSSSSTTASSTTSESDPDPTSTQTKSTEEEKEKEEEKEEGKNKPTTTPDRRNIPLSAREPTNSCQQCNRAFCQSYNLPMCKDTDEKDIKTTCFQRDSNKDRVIVWCFILGTGGLLGWAGVRRVVASAKERRRLRGGHQGGGGAAAFGSGRAGRSRNGGRGLGLFGQHGPGPDRAVYDPLQDGYDVHEVRGAS